jgi:hypothetical protein
MSIIIQTRRDRRNGLARRDEVGASSCGGSASPAAPAVDEGPNAGMLATNIAMSTVTVSTGASAATGQG